MKKSKVQIDQCCSPNKNRGIALLLMLSLLIIVLTTVVIARLSLNDLAQKRQAETLKTLTETRDAIMAWTLTQNFLTNRPPGTLPCPASTRAGNSNIQPSGLCASTLGLVPYRDLGIPEPIDSYGNPLWYAVAVEYVGNANAPTLRNSSAQSNLTIVSENNVNSRRVAFVVIAPNDAIDGQVQVTNPMAARGNFLDGKNADGNLNEFTDQKVPDTATPNVHYNDTILAMPVRPFWSAVEEVVLSQVTKLLQDYNTASGAYPWAVTFSDTDDNSDNGVLEGRVPLGVASPNIWGAGGTPAIPPWLSTHWSRMLYYSMCSPISSPCIQLQDANNALLQMASVVIIAPGVHSSELFRPPSVLINEFFERQNQTVNDNTFHLIPKSNHDGSFNDVLKRVAP